MRKHQDPPTHHHKSPSDWNRHFMISNYVWSILEVTMMNCVTWLGTLSRIPVRYCTKSKLSPFRGGINRIKLGYIVHWIVCFWRTHIMTKEQKKKSFFLFFFSFFSHCSLAIGVELWLLKVKQVLWVDWHWQSDRGLGRETMPSCTNQVSQDLGSFFHHSICKSQLGWFPPALSLEEGKLNFVILDRRWVTVRCVTLAKG